MCATASPFLTHRVTGVSFFREASIATLAYAFVCLLVCLPGLFLLVLFFFFHCLEKSSARNPHFDFIFVLVEGQDDDDCIHRTRMLLFQSLVIKA